MTPQYCAYEDACRQARKNESSRWGKVYCDMLQLVSKDIDTEVQNGKMYSDTFIDEHPRDIVVIDSLEHLQNELDEMGYIYHIESIRDSGVFIRVYFYPKKLWNRLVCWWHFHFGEGLHLCIS